MFNNDASVSSYSRFASMVQWLVLDLCTSGSRCKPAMGLDSCTKGVFHPLHSFSWLDMTYDVERAIKPCSFIHPSK